MNISSAAREFHFTKNDFRRIQQRIGDLAGIVLSDNKADMVYSRLARRLRFLGLSAFDEYVQRVLEDKDEEREFINALTTNLTSFFREAHHFDTLTELMQSKSGQIKIWCGASSTGEEPYSIAMTAVECFGRWSPPVRIIATDLDTKVLAVAERGIYPIERLKAMEADRLKVFFRRGRNENEGLARVVSPLRQLIHFSALNLLDAQWPIKAPVDAIFLRNVFIYFDKDTQYQILRKCRALIADDGRLFIGHSESLTHATDLFTLVSKTVYQPAGVLHGR